MSCLSSVRLSSMYGTALEDESWITVGDKVGEHV
jgi:hypothetical protein